MSGTGATVMVPGDPLADVRPAEDTVEEPPIKEKPPVDTVDGDGGDGLVDGDGDDEDGREDGEKRSRVKLARPSRTRCTPTSRVSWSSQNRMRGFAEPAPPCDAIRALHGARK